MLWMIEGADRSTGQERRQTVEAADEAEARQLAGVAGIVVSTVGPAPTVPVTLREPQYKYRVVDFNPAINAGSALEPVAAALERVLNEAASKGWQFVRVEQVRFVVRAERFAGMRVAQKDGVEQSNFIVFRRPL